MHETSVDDTLHYTAREVVAVFADTKGVEAAIEQLAMAGVDRAALSVRGVDTEPPSQLGAASRSALAIAKDQAAPRAAFISHGTRVEGKAVAIALPLQIGSFAGAWAVAAAGGALVAAIGAAAVGGAVGAGLGILLLRAVAHHHAAGIEAQLTQGGLILWVATPDDAAEPLVRDVLCRNGGQSVHEITTVKTWGAADTPLHDVQPDPFLVSTS
jgi:hypothetical protein